MHTMCITCMHLHTYNISHLCRCIAIWGPMRTRPSHRTLTAKQKSSDSHGRNCNNKENAVDHLRAAVGGNEDLCINLSQRLVKLVWFSGDPFQIHEPKSTFTGSLAVSYFNRVCSYNARS